MTSSGFRTTDGILSVYESQHLVEHLTRFSLAEVGSTAWMKQHDVMEKLNIQAHHNALTQHDEFVVEAFNTRDQVSLLVHDLIVIEAYRKHVFPLVVEKLTAQSSLKAYMVLYHEATLCNLLEVLMFHTSIIETAGDSVIELLDYCVRQLTALNSGYFKPLQKPVPIPEQESIQQTLARQMLDMQFSCACSSVTVIRYITENIPACPIATVLRLQSHHDILLSLVPLIERPPWTRDLKKEQETGEWRGGVEKYVEGKWLPVKRDDLPRLTKLEGQVWLSIYNLVMDPSCAKSYEFHAMRKDNLTGLRKYFHEVLLDQLPMLKALHRTIEQLVVMNAPAVSSQVLCVIEQVPQIQEGIMQGVNFQDIAAQQLVETFSTSEEARKRDMALMASTYNLDNFDEVLEDPSCSACGVPATNR